MFGAAEHISHMILAAMRFDRDVRAAMNIRYDGTVLKAMEEAGMKITTFDRVKYPDADLGELTALAIRSCGSIPDAIYDPGTDGKGMMIRLLGTDISDIGRKAERTVASLNDEK